MLNAARFNGFIQGLTDLVDKAQDDEPRLLLEGTALLEHLVALDDWLEPAYAQPHPDHYQQFLLYRCPDQRFSVVSFVWGPGQKTPVHDHTVWGLIGMLRGSETGQSFKLGTPPGSPMMPGHTDRLDPGMVDKVSPTIGDIHRVANAYDDQVSISIHVYGADIGQVRRHVFDVDTSTPREFISGYANKS